MHSSIYLDLLIVVPLLGALAAMLVRKVPNASFLAGVATSVLEFALSVVVFALYNNHLKGAGTFDFLSRHVLSAPLGLAWDVGIDGISLILIMLTTIVLPLALYGARERRHEASFVAWMLVLTAFTVGSFISHDVLEFFIFFELTLVPSYFIIAGWGGAQRARAALKFFIYTFGASAFLFIGVLYLGFLHQHQTGGALTFSDTALASTVLTHGTSVWLFLAFAVAFAVKSPIWPLHTWSPITYAEAPTGGSIQLSALLAKLGSYGLLRFAVGLFPLALVTMRPLFLTLAVIGILYGSFVACATPGLEASRRVLVARPDGLCDPGRDVGFGDRGDGRGALDVQPRHHHDWLLPLDRLHRAAARFVPDQGPHRPPGPGPDSCGPLHGRDDGLDRPARTLGLRE